MSVIWAARLLLVSAAAVLAFGGIFIVISTGIRMKNGEWLRRAGPFEISETAVSEIEGQVKFWRQAALAGQEEVAELTERLEESDELIGARMAKEQIHKRVEQTLRRNQAAVKQANSRGQRLSRAAERSTIVIDRAFRQLRQGG